MDCADNREAHNTVSPFILHNVTFLYGSFSVVLESCDYLIGFTIVHSDSGRFTMVLSGSQRFSIVLSGSGMVLSGSQRFPMVLSGSQWFW